MLYQHTRKIVQRKSRLLVYVQDDAHITVYLNCVVRSFFVVGLVFCFSGDMGKTGKEFESARFCNMWCFMVGRRRKDLMVN